jgi:hypothetical protein
MAHLSKVVSAPTDASRSATAARKPVSKCALEDRCLWCERPFTPRSTGGSAQKFCCTGHRQQFWIAARRWTMRAIQAGLPIDRLPKGVSYERARCLRGIPAIRDIPHSASPPGHVWTDLLRRLDWLHAFSQRTAILLRVTEQLAATQRDIPVPEDNSPDRHRTNTKP